VAWLCDIWGVLHNGVAAFPHAVEACRMYRRTGGVVLLVSNAPRPAAAVAQQLLNLGVSDDAYDSILTSGDVTRDLLATLGNSPIHHIGPDRDLGIFDGLAVVLTKLEHASALVCTGLFDDTRETAEDYRGQVLQTAMRYGLPMICANPDIHVERGGKIIACAGAVAAVYANMGGDVQYAGKPHPAVYRAAVDRIASLLGRAVDQSELLAIGDGINTDIKGAAAEGIPSIYVASPVHLKVPFNASSLAALFEPLAFRPTAAIDALRWGDDTA
jgi:HAD superfamily hydrolase (TIGR01459 family)